MPASTDASVLKEARQQCHKARDAFFACVEASGQAFVVGGPHPPQCKQQRKAFEEACRTSWVLHFDKIYSKKQDYLRQLQQNIGRSAKDALGSIQGEAQQ